MASGSLGERASEVGGDVGELVEATASILAAVRGGVAADGVAAREGVGDVGSAAPWSDGTGSGGSGRPSAARAARAGRRGLACPGPPRGGGGPRTVSIVVSPVCSTWSSHRTLRHCSGNRSNARTVSRCGLGDRLQPGWLGDAGRLVVAPARAQAPGRPRGRTGAVAAVGLPEHQGEGADDGRLRGRSGRGPRRGRCARRWTHVGRRSGGRPADPRRCTRWISCPHLHVFRVSVITGEFALTGRRSCRLGLGGRRRGR